MSNHNIQTGLKGSLAKLIKEKGKYSQDGYKVVSFATQQARRENLFKIFNEIRCLKFKIQDVKNLKGKHIYILLKFYVDCFEKKTLSAATIRNRLSHLRTFCEWINKPGLIKPLEHYTKVPINRSSIAKQSKTWTDKGINPLEKINLIRNEEPRIADILSLQLYFGLRTKESILIKPHLADKGSVLIINHGAKGGRNRFIPIDTIEQRELLDNIKKYVGLNESMIPLEE